MVDIHTHVLPYVDDGASTLYESLDMLRLAEKTGTKKLVMTPHFYNPRIGHMNKEKIVNAFNEYCKKAAECKVELFLGSEVFCSNLFLSEIQKKNFLTVNQTEYIMIEFGFDFGTEYMLSALDTITNAGYRPIIAHPERYIELKQEPYVAEQLIRKGGLLQVNTTSIMMPKSTEMNRFTMWLLDNRLVSFVSSDAHDIIYRSTNMQKAFTKVYGEISKEYAEKLFFENPEAVVSGNNLISIW